MGKVVKVIRDPEVDKQRRLDAAKGKRLQPLSKKVLAKPKKK